MAMAAGGSGARRVSSSSVSTPNSDEFVMVPDSGDVSPPVQDNTADDDGLEEPNDLKSAFSELDEHDYAGRIPGLLIHNDVVSVEPTVLEHSNCDANTSLISSSVESSSASAVPSSVVEPLVFFELSYHGSSSVNAPRSEAEAQRTMAILREQQHAPLTVMLSVPRTPGGAVRILDADGGEICSFPVQRILFCTRGHHGTPENDCFSFTENHNSSAIFRIHTFQCTELHVVSHLLHSFADAFEFRSHDVQRPIQSLDHNVTCSHDVYTFCVTLEIREDDGKGNFRYVAIAFQEPEVNVG
uniref:rab GTPase-activating protein 1-like n=1 Tax=Myxine glutinosa TaxID=7769 RepID=UPI00358F254D